MPWDKEVSACKESTSPEKLHTWEGLREKIMNEHFINTHVIGRGKQTVIHPAHIQSARHAINKPRAGLCQIYGLRSENTPLPAGARGGRVPSLRRAVGTVAHPRRVPSPQCPIVRRGPRVKPGESVFALPAGPSYLISAAATIAQVYSPFCRRERANRGPGPSWPGRPAAGPPGWW